MRTWLMPAAFCTFVCALWTAAADAGQPPEVRQNMAISRLEAANTEAQLVEAINALRHTNIERAPQAIAQAAIGPRGTEAVQMAAVETIAVMRTSNVATHLAALARAEQVKLKIRRLAVARLGEVLGSQADAEAARALDEFSSDRSMEPLADAAIAAVTAAVRGNPGVIETLAALQAGTVQHAAVAEVARLRRLDAEMPIADIGFVEQWRNRRIERLTERLEFNREQTRVGPSHGKHLHARAARLQAAALDHVRGLSLAETGVELLAEFYDTTERTQRAVGNAAKFADLAEAAESLPSISWTVEERELVRGYERLVSSTDFEFDLSMLSIVFRGLATEEAFKASHARGLADEAHSALSRLSPSTLDRIRLGYARSVTPAALAEKRDREQEREFRYVRSRAGFEREIALEEFLGQFPDHPEANVERVNLQIAALKKSMTELRKAGKNSQRDRSLKLASDQLEVLQNELRDWRQKQAAEVRRKAAAERERRMEEERNK